MARIPAIDPSEATGQTSTLLDQVQAKLGATPNMMRTMAHAPALLRGYLAFSGALGGGVLRPQVREQLALVVSQANTCQYCVSAHTTMGEMAGLSGAELASARQGSAPDPKVQAALQFARAVVEYRGDLTDDEFEAVRLAGYSDAEITEIVGHVVLSIFTNYFNKVMLTEVDFPLVDLGPDVTVRAA